ncbi:MAG: SpoIID/LytB domain-containing protein, partial [Spirochaetia bacterium]|nr:SpoIID/LytB domain-containing protein [Spirochaetia bacterium]
MMGLKPVFATAAALIASFLFSSCISMSERYAGSQKNVDIRQEELKPKDTENYGQKPDGAAKAVQVQQQSDSPIIMKVLIKRSKLPIKLTSDSYITTSWKEFQAARSVEFSAATGGIAVNGTPAGQKKIEVSSDSRIKYAGKEYRGSFIIYMTGEELLAVNSVPLEEYLYGVLPAEVSPGWPQEVLKAQAVAARTFAL